MTGSSKNSTTSSGCSSNSGPSVNKANNYGLWRKIQRNRHLKITQTGTQVSGPDPNTTTKYIASFVDTMQLVATLGVTSPPPNTLLIIHTGRAFTGPGSPQILRRKRAKSTRPRRFLVESNNRRHLDPSRHRESLLCKAS